MKTVDILRKNGSLKNKKEKAITLIALVITIMVLLILAGVTVATLTGENGLLSKTATARQRTKEGEQDEKDKLDLYENELSNYATMPRTGNDFNINDLELDYDNKVNISGYTSSNNRFTVPSTGVVIASGYITTTASMAFIYINDIRVCFIGGSNGGFYAGGGYSQIVTKNTNIYFDLEVSNLYSAYFVPFK